MSQPPFGQQPYPEQPGSPAGYPPPGNPPGHPQKPGYGPPQPGFGPPQPGFGQPQPGFGQPQPGFGQPQPGFGQPQPGFGPPPGYPMAPPPPKKSKVVPIVLTSVAIVLVLCIGGLAALFLVGKNAKDDADAAAAKITITEPETLGGRAKLESAEFAPLIAGMERDLAAYPGASSSFGAFYGSPADQDMVAALATKATILDPRKELTASWAAFGKSVPVSGVTAASTGDLGGVAECGTSNASGVDVAVCGWADEGSVGMVMMFLKKAADVQDEFPKLRAEIEKKED